MSLREKIGTEIARAFVENHDVGMLTEKILSLIDSEPSGLQAERECEHTSYYSKIRCSFCNGSGNSLRDIPNKEALKWAKDVVVTRLFHGSINILPSGERVVVKEEK